MFFPFNRARKITVPRITTNNDTVFTAIRDSLVAFVPRGSDMRHQKLVTLYIDEYYTDTQGTTHDKVIFSADKLNNPSTKVLIAVNDAVLLPDNKTIKAFIQDDNDDYIGGTLYVWEIPPDYPEI